ncbi:MAG: hypothetical protein E7460_11340, partial [Ruminococcaceae bacterium]|nr:hypothetical protein [Oscillospiraceae bacterium]
MELEIKKGTFRGCVPVYSKTLTAEESTDAVVPDSKPDILRIADARCVAELSGKELRGGKVYLSGTVKCFVIYAPEGASAPESLGVSLPFSVAADPGEDCRGAVIRARVMGASVLAREQNPRRINLRATVRLGLELWCSREISWCEDIANAGEYFVEMLSEELRTVAVGGFGEKMLSISESAELGEVRVTGAELMSWELRPAVNDVKLIPGKAVFKGNLDVRALLKTPSDGSATAQIALSVPFSGVTDCEGADPDGEVGIFVRCFDSELSLTELIREVCEESAMIDAGHEWVFKGDTNVLLTADSAMLKQCARVLCENAQKYAPSGSTITLVVRRNAEGAQFSVQDEGIGIGAEDVAHVFDRFYR